MDQHTWVQQCTEYYEENGLTPGNPDDGEWEEAHYPNPKGVGEETIWLLHDHHQPQGLWQSEECGRCCFFNADALKFLKEGPFVPGWFDLWDLYDKWSGYYGRSTKGLKRSDTAKENNRNAQIGKTKAKATGTIQKRERKNLPLSAPARVGLKVLATNDEKAPLSPTENDQFLLCALLQMDPRLCSSLLLTPQDILVLTGGASVSAARGRQSL
jgi:hypothetical protein